MKREGQLNANCWEDILTIQDKYLIFQFITCGMQTAVSSKGGEGCKTDALVTEKLVIRGLNKPVLKLNLQGEGQLYVNCSEDILAIYGKCPLFYFIVPSEQGVKTDVSGTER